MYRKLVSLVGSGLILVSVFMSLFIAILPTQASATATEPQDEERRLLVAFKYCLSDQKIDESDNGNPAENFPDMWDGGIDGYKKENVVVGFELEDDNGVKSCETSILPGLKILEPQITTAAAAETRLFALLANSDGKVFRANRDKLVTRIDDKIKAMGADPRKAFTANRLSPLITYCYDIKVDRPSFEATNQNFRAKLLGTEYFFEHKKADDDSFKWIDQKGLSLNAYIGDVELGFRSSLPPAGLGGWDSFESDFYPFGSDLQSFTGGHTENNSILDCKFIKEKMEAGFFTNDVISSVDIDKDIVVTGVDTNGDGKADVALDPVTVASVDSGGDTHVDCQTGGLSLNPFTLADNAISWLLCPLLDGAQAIVNTVGGWVVDQLEFDVDQYLIGPTTDKNDQEIFPVKDAWNAFRVISLSLVILVALAGILMGSFIDAYTIKKILPRMLIAIIAISLSWDLLVLVIKITNSLGIAVRSMIDLPFKSLNNAAINPLVILGGAGAATGLTTILGALSLIGTAALAVLFAFIFTILRVGAIIALVIFAPVAILCWILPGTQKGWNFWQEGLMGALLMFPIVTAFLSIGSAFGKIIYNIDPNKPLNQTIALVATYAPYFLIPKAFSMAGGIVGNLSGQLNDRGRGAFDRLKKFRQDQGQKRRHDVMAGKYFKPGNEESRFGRFKNKTSDKLQTALLSPQMGIGTGDLRTAEGRKQRLATMSGNLQNAKELAEWEHSTEMLKNNAFARKYAQDDDFGKGLLEGDGDYAKTRAAIAENGGARFDGEAGQKELDNLTAAALRVRREAGAGAAGLVAIRGLGTSSTSWKTKFKKDAAGNDIIDEANGDERYGYRIIDGEESNIKMQRSIDKALGHGRGNLANVIAEVRSGQDAAGRPDNGSSSFSDTLYANKLLHEMGPRPTPPPAGASAVEVQQYQDGVADYDEKVKEISRSLYLSTLEGKPAGAVIGGKEQPAENLTRVMVEDTEGIINGNRKGKWGQAAVNQPAVGSEAHEEAVIQALMYEEGSRVAATQYSKAGGAALSKGLTREIDLTSLPPRIRQALTLKGYRNEEQFQTNSAGEVEKIVNQVPIYQEGDTITHAQAIDNLQRTNPKAAASVKIYVEQATAAAAQQQAAMAATQGAQAQANAQGQNRDFIPPTTPTLGGGTGGFGGRGW